MNDSEIHSKDIVIATGVAYKKLEIPGLDTFTGAGVYYGSAAVEARACRNEIIYIVGGGNSACQAALYMSKFAREVNIIIRRDKLSQTAANYLVENINRTSNIHVIVNSDVISCSGSSVLENIIIRNANPERNPFYKSMFVYIGTKPGTEWLNNLVLESENAFILSGSELMKDKSFHTCWKLDREPYLTETSIPGIFAAGDVRYGAMTGISAAVGEGSMAIRFVRKYLEEM
jgi:thioredoxin reductase (NADPH)